MKQTSDVKEFKIDDITPELFVRLIYLTTKFRDVEPIILAPYQIKLGWTIIDAIINNRQKEIFGFMSRQSGKTETIADIVYTLMVLASICDKYKKRPFRIGIFAPKKEQADIAYTRIKERFETGFAKEMLGVEIIEKNKSMIRLSNGAMVKSITASIAATIEGETFDLIIVEEAQDVADVRIKKSIFPMLSRTKGSRVLIGTSTPEKASGYFLDSVRLHPERVIKIDCYEAAKHSPTYAAYIKDMENTLGKDSAEFKTQYLLEPIDYATTFTSEKELTVLRRKKFYRKAKFDGPTVIGIDVAKKPDSTVVTVLDATEPRILNWLEIQHDDYNSQLTQILTFIGNYKGLIRIVGDGFGPGAVILDFLSNYLDQSKTFKDVEVVILKPHVRKKSSLYMAAREAIRNGLFYYPETKCPERAKFEKQFIGLRMEFSESVNCFKISHPAGEHDDYPDSFTYAWFGLIAGSPYLMEAGVALDTDDMTTEEDLSDEFLYNVEDGKNNILSGLLNTTVTPSVHRKGPHKEETPRWKRRRTGRY